MIWCLTRKLNNRHSGFTFIELVLTMSLLGFLSVASISYIDQVVDEEKFEKTHLTLKKIKKALIGDPWLVTQERRIGFGYLGDIGNLPTSGEGLSALITKPVTHNNWAANSTARFGLGWSGPYIDPTDPGSFSFEDAWGNALVYSPTLIPPVIRSLGADGLVGGSGFDQDITYQISLRLEKASVYGFILNGGAVWSGTAEVEINYPNGLGVLQQTLTSVIPSNNGYFSFTNIPLGVRSATIYVPSKAGAVQTVGPFVFTVDENHIVIPVGLTDVALNKVSESFFLLAAYD